MPLFYRSNKGHAGVHVPWLIVVVFEVFFVVEFDKCKYKHTKLVYILICASLLRKPQYLNSASVSFWGSCVKKITSSCCYSRCIHSSICFYYYYYYLTNNVTTTIEVVDNTFSNYSTGNYSSFIDISTFVLIFNVRYHNFQFQRGLRTVACSFSCAINRLSTLHVARTNFMDQLAIIQVLFACN